MRRASSRFRRSLPPRIPSSTVPTKAGFPSTIAANSRSRKPLAPESDHGRGSGSKALRTNRAGRLSRPDTPSRAPTFTPGSDGTPFVDLLGQGFREGHRNDRQWQRLPRTAMDRPNYGSAICSCPLASQGFLQRTSARSHPRQDTASRRGHELLARWHSAPCAKEPRWPGGALQDFCRRTA